jgi:hypothetical protein
MEGARGGWLYSDPSPPARVLKDKELVILDGALGSVKGM